LIIGRFRFRFFLNEKSVSLVLSVKSELKLGESLVWCGCYAIQDCIICIKVKTGIRYILRNVIYIDKLKRSGPRTEP